MRLLIFFTLFSISLHAQNLSYSPAQTLEKTVSLQYYDTEYIFIDNVSDYFIPLSFELVSKNIPEAWSVSGCTNMICYVNIPDDGSLGTCAPGEQVYLSINLSVNETAGDGELVYVVFDEELPQNKDTLRFVYHAEDNGNTAPQPWAHISFAQQILTVFLVNETTETTLQVFDVNGNCMVETVLKDITSYSMTSFPQGVYVVVVRDENGKKLVQKIVTTN